jgi:phosphotransferase system IIA component
LVEPFDHVFPVELEDVKVTEPPEQNVVTPLAVKVGVVGTGLTVTTVGIELAVHVPFDTVTVYEPL